MKSVLLLFWFTQNKGELDQYNKIKLPLPKKNSNKVKFKDVRAMLKNSKWFYILKIYVCMRINYIVFLSLLALFDICKIFLTWPLLNDREPNVKM